MVRGASSPAVREEGLAVRVSSKFSDAAAGPAFPKRDCVRDRGEVERRAGSDPAGLGDA